MNFATCSTEVLLPKSKYYCSREHDKNVRRSEEQSRLHIENETRVSFSWIAGETRMRSWQRTVGLLLDCF